MSKYNEGHWKFGRLSVDEKVHAKGLFEKEDFSALRSLLLEKKAAPEDFECDFCYDVKELRQWVKWAIATNKL